MTFLLEMRKQKVLNKNSATVFKMLHALYTFGGEKENKKIPDNLDKIAWEEIKVTLGKSDFIPRLKEYSSNYQEIPKKLINTFVSEMGEKSKWDIDLIKKASTAAFS